MARTESVRAFIAIELPEAHRAALADFVDRWRATQQGVRWVPAENLHLTLRFLGEVPKAQLEAIEQDLRAAVAPLSAFRLCFGQPGAFPARGAPRVLWVGLEGDLMELTTLHEAVERALGPYALPASDERFSPHVTVGRVRAPRLPGGLAAPTELAETPPLVVNAISLMASTLTPQGANYSRLARLAFASDKTELG